MIWGMVPASRGLGTSAVNHVLFFFCIRTSGFHSLMSLFDPLSCFLICLNLHFVVVTDINVNLRWNWSIFLLSLSPSLVNYSHLHSGISNHVLTPWYISVQISWLKYLVYHIFSVWLFCAKTNIDLLWEMWDSATGMQVSRTSNRLHLESNEVCLINKWKTASLKIIKKFDVDMKYVCLLLLSYVIPL